MTTQALIGFFADGAVIPVALLGIYALFFRVPKGHRFEAYSRVLMAGITSYLIAKLLGSVFQPSGERPFEVLGTIPGASYLDNPGFPSDHALFTGALTLAVWFETRQKGISLIMAVLTLAVGVSRVLALVHTPLDIIGGFVVAGIGAFWYLQASRSKAITTTRKKDKKRVQ
jgi:membrane-associated phospholipid phosphatase